MHEIHTIIDDTELSILMTALEVHINNLVDSKKFTEIEAEIKQTNAEIAATRELGFKLGVEV